MQISAEVCSSSTPEVSTWTCLARTGCLVEALSARLLHFLVAWWACSVGLRVISGGVLETSGNLQVDSRDLLYSRQQHVDASELQLQLCCWADDVIMHQNRPGWILPASQEHPVCPDLMLSGLQRGQVPEGGCRMR